MKTQPKTDSSLPEITIPDDWNKLNRRQLFMLAWLINLGLESHHFKVIAINRLAGIKITGNYYVEEETGNYMFQLKHRRQKFFVGASVYNEILKRVVFMTKPPTLTKQLIPHFSLLLAGLRLPVATRLKFPIFNFSFPIFNFYGPDEALYNITYNELIHAQLASANFENTKEPKYLNTLVAILYRPKRKHLNKKDPKWDGDIRSPFSAYTYSRRAKWFRLVPFKIKYAIYIFFIGSVSHMANEHPMCFSPSTRISSKPKSVNPATALIDLVPVITKGDPTKNKQLYESPAWDVFDAYERTLEEFEAMKQKK